MRVPTTTKALSSALVVIAGAVTVLSGISMYLQGEPMETWLPTVAFGLLFPTFLVPSALDEFRPDVTEAAKRTATGAVFGLWVAVGGGLLLAGLREFLGSLIVVVGVVGIVAITVRTSFVDAPS